MPLTLTLTLSGRAPGPRRRQAWLSHLHCCHRFLNGLLPFGSTELRCNPGQFACRSGAIQCIPLPWQCDGWVTCEDESDEADCPGECVGLPSTPPPSQLCDCASVSGGTGGVHCSPGGSHSLEAYIELKPSPLSLLSLSKNNCSTQADPRICKVAGAGLG